MEPEVTSEAAVNEAAQAEVAASQEQVAEKTVAAPVSEQKTVPPNTASTEQAAFDAQKSYKELEKQLSETRKWATQMSQERADHRRKVEAYEKQQAEFKKRIEEMSEAPFNLEQFNKDFVQKGFKAFDPYLEKKLSSIREQYEPTVQEQAQTISELKTNMLILQARGDSKNYPNFADLEDTMASILQSPTCPIDRNLPLDQKLQAAYQLAKTQNSTEAIKAAKEVGYQKAQADLAKEARSAVATGGKGVSASPADLQTMPLDKLEAYVKRMYGVADRD